MRRMRNLRRGVRSLVFGLIVVAVGSVSATAGAGAGGGVMPPTAKPHGVSRADMTEALAVFSISGNDPAFLPVDVSDGRTMAELADAEKDAISHRGRAARALLAWLRAGGAGS